MNGTKETGEQLPQPALNAKERAISFGGAKGHKQAWIALGAILLLLAFAWGVRYWLWARAHEETDDAYIAGHLHAVSSRVAGTVELVEVDDNQDVAQGQALVHLDEHDFKVRLEQAEAALVAAQQQAATAFTTISYTSQNATADAAQAQGGIRQAKAGIDAAKAAVVEAEAGVSHASAVLTETEATLERAKVDDQRYSNLIKKEQVSRQQYDHVHAAYKVALASKFAAETGVHEAEARLAHAQYAVQEAQGTFMRANGSLVSAKASFTNVEVRKKQYQAAQANVAQAQAAVNDARLQLSYTVIDAPAAGIIGRKAVEVGQRVQPGQPLLAVVEHQTWVIANFKETQLTHMRVGEQVDIELDRFPERTFHGRVQSLSPASGAEFALLPPDNATGNFTKIVQRIPVKILLDPDSVNDYANYLAPGMSAVVTVKVR